MIDKLIYIFLKFFFLCKKNIRFNKSNKIKNILIFAYTGLGNFILYTPFIRELRSSFPDAKISIIYDKKTGCIEPIKNSNLYDNTIFMDRNAGWLERFKIIKRLYIEKYDLSINEFHNGSAFLMLITTLCIKKFRMGHVTSPGWNNKWDFIYNIPVKMKLDQHEIERYMSFLKPLGINPKNADRNTFFFLRNEDNRYANTFLVKNNLKNKHLIGIQSGSSPPTSWKRWEAEKYIELSNCILNETNTEIILFGSGSESKIIDRIETGIEQEVINISGKTTIKQAAAIINMLDLLVCNDSGLMHVAVAVDTPVIAIYGPTDFTRTAPLGEKHIIIRKNYNCSPCFKMEGKNKVTNCPFNYKCLNDISVDEVFEKVKERLKIEN